MLPALLSAGPSRSRRCWRPCFHRNSHAGVRRGRPDLRPVVVADQVGQTTFRLHRFSYKDMFHATDGSVTISCSTLEGLEACKCTFSASPTQRLRRRRCEAPAGSLWGSSDRKSSQGRGWKDFAEGKEGKKEPVRNISGRWIIFVKT